MAVTKLVLVRHGESQWNKENRFTGWYDVDLSEKGVSRLPSTPIATHWDGETLSSSCSNQYPVPTADVVYDTPVVIFSI